MATRKNDAAEKKRSGKYNCAQAVLCTYCDKALIDEKTAYELGYAFANGMGNQEGTCGALVGAGMVLGLMNKDKVAALKNMREIMMQFQKRNGATQCKLLKGTETKKILRECPLCVADAAEFLEETFVKDNL